MDVLLIVLTSICRLQLSFMISSLEQLQQEYSGIRPKPVVKIAKDLNIRVFGTASFEDDHSGSIARENGEYVIYVNKNHPVTRQRFTIAHEIGHFLEHKSHLDSGTEFEDGVKRKVSNGEGHLERRSGVLMSTEQIGMEKKANEIAADILMPKEEFIEIWNQYDTIEEVAEIFGVSDAAVAVRAKVLLGETIF